MIDKLIRYFMFDDVTIILEQILAGLLITVAYVGVISIGLRCYIVYLRWQLKKLDQWGKKRG